MAEQHWLVVTGAASGIMEAGHVGAGRENSMGLNIMLPFEQYANPIIAGDPEARAHEVLLHAQADVREGVRRGVPACPAASARSTKGWKCSRCCKPASATWCRWCSSTRRAATSGADFQEFVETRLLGDGMISPEDLSLYKLTDNVDEAVDEILQFFRVYHSMRYVKNKLVLRLQRSALAASCSTRSTRNFADILSGGDVHDWPARCPRRRTSPSWPTLPRLVFRFNRRSLGRLAATDRRPESGASLDPPHAP